MLALLLTARWVEPSPKGHGSHTQLLLQPCLWAAYFNKPCPTCGMTTAFAYAARGNLLQSFLTQPFGMVLAVSSAAIFWIALFVTVTGSTLARAMSGWVGSRALWLMLAGLLAGWAWKLATWTGY